MMKSTAGSTQSYRSGKRLQDQGSNITTLVELRGQLSNPSTRQTLAWLHQFIKRRC
jgi:hypothetical protein